MRFFTNFKAIYLLFILALGAGAFFLFNNLLVFSANLFLLAIFIFIYEYLKRYSINLKIHISFLPAFLILVLVIYHYILKYNLTMPALLLTLACGFFIYKIKKCSTLNLIFEKTILCAIILALITPNIVMAIFFSREKSLAKENHAIVSELYSNFEKSKEDVSGLTSGLTTNEAVISMLQDKKYAELLAYLQNIKTANDFDYILIKDPLDNIVVNTQHESLIGGDFSSEYPKAVNQAYSDIKVFDGRVLVCAEREINSNTEKYGHIIAGKYPKAKTALLELKKSHPSLLALMITSEDKTTAFASDDMGLESLSQTDIARQIPTDRINASYLGGEKLIFFKSNLLTESGGSLNLIIISRNDISRESRSNIVYIVTVILFLIFTGYGIFHMRRYFKDNLPVNIRKIIAGKAINAEKIKLFYRRFSGYCGVMSIGIFVGFIFFMALIIKNFDIISSNYGKPVNPVRSTSSLEQVVNQLPTITPENIYLSTGDETTLSLYSSTTPPTDFDIDINIDPTYLEIGAVTSKTHNCKSFINSTLKLSCTINNEEARDRTIATIALRAKKEGFASVSLDKIIIYGNENVFSELTLNDKVVLLIK